jgi:hypothetical protein
MKNIFLVIFTAISIAFASFSTASESRDEGCGIREISTIQKERVSKGFDTSPGKCVYTKSMEADGSKSSLGILSTVLSLVVLLAFGIVLKGGKYHKKP